MEFFEMLVVNEGLDSVGTPDDASEEWLNELAQLDSEMPLRDRWRPLTAQYFHEEGTSKTDLYDFPTCVCVLNESAEIFSSIDGLELLPINATNVPSFCPNSSPFGYLLHFTSRVGLLDGSVVEYFPGTNSIASLEKALVSSESIHSRGVFQLEGNPVAIYCTELFRQEFLRRNLTGVAFEEVSDVMRCV